MAIKLKVTQIVKRNTETKTKKSVMVILMILNDVKNMKRSPIYQFRYLGMTKTVSFEDGGAFLI